MSGFTPTDAQRLALTLDGRDILVSAAAGSGKTATLTQRIIQRLISEDEATRGDISRMLIVTFTRAAAAELRARIAAALSEEIAKSKDNPYLHKQLLALGSAHISTIDSFYQETVRANFERLGLPAGFRLADEVELTPLKERILDGLIDRYYARAATSSPDERAMLDQLSDNEFARAMDDLIVNRDNGDTAKILLALFDKLLSFPEELSLLLKGAERLEAQAALPLAQTDEGRIVVDHLINKLTSAQNELNGAITLWAEDTYTAQNYIPPAQNDLETLERIIAALRRGAWDQARQFALSYEAMSLGRKGKADPNPPFDAEALKAIRNNVKAILVELPKNEMEYDEAEYRDRMHRTARTQRMLYTLLSDYDAEISEEKKKRGTLEFSDIRRYMLKLLQNEKGEPSDIARTLCDRFDAVYIDEYQDVDAVQDRIFALVGAGGKRFMVGDIKQSIYAFRGSDPSLFAGYRKLFPTVEKENDPNLSPDGNCIFMSENFRCDTSVIDAANGVCGYAFEVCPDSLAYDAKNDDLKPGKKSPDGYKPTPARLIVLEKPAERTKDPDPKTALRAEAVAVAEEIARLIHSGQPLANGAPIRAGDVAVLMRSMTMAGDLIKALRAYGIDTSYAPRENLAAHPQMTMMVDLLSVIDNPHDDVPLMGLLASDGSPISLTDVLSARGLSSRATSLYDDLCAAIDDPNVSWSDATRAAMRALCTHLSRWRELSKTLSVDRLLRKLYAEPFLKHLINTPALIALYDHARNYQSSSFCGLYQFLQYFRRLLDQPDGLSVAGLKENENAVHIMTIHKSKGLEFPVVFLCNCSKKFNDKDQTAPVIFDQQLGTATTLFYPDDASQQTSLTRRAIALRIDERATEEEMRLLYVAMTRARERLYLTAQLPQSRFETLQKRAERATRGNRYEILSVNNYLDWILPAVIPPNAKLASDCVKLTVLNKDLYRHPHTLAEVLAAAPPVECGATEVASSEPPSKQDAPQAPKLHENEQFYRAILAAHEGFVDPHARFRTLPTKAAASKLHESMLDGSWLARAYGDLDDDADDALSERDAERDVRRRIEQMQGKARSFEERLSESTVASPAERGTAAHLFLQHFDVKKLASLGVEGEIERLCKEGFLTGRAAEVLRRDHLKLFASSDLYALLSERDVRIRRELHFDRFIPYKTLAADASLAEQLGDYTLYVQGSIDLLVEQADGTLWLFDYKTDRIRGDAEQKGEDAVRAQLLADHATQLRVYAEAVQGLFGRRPDHVLIYSLPLGRSIELTAEL